jgi:hypothetical protein
MAAKRLLTLMARSQPIEPNKWQLKKPLILLKDRLPIRQRDLQRDLPLLPD